MHLCILTYVWMHAFVMCMCICLCIYVNVCMYVCVCMCMCVYMYVYVYMCVYVYIYTHTKCFIRFAVQYLLTFHSSLSDYRSIFWCWTASRNVYFELTQEDFLSSSQNTFVYLYILQWLLACLNFTVESEDLSFWYKWKKWFLWTMAALQEAENHEDEWGLIWYFLWVIHQFQYIHQFQPKPTHKIH